MWAQSNCKGLYKTQGQGDLVTGEEKAMRAQQQRLVGGGQEPGNASSLQKWERHRWTHSEAILEPPEGTAPVDSLLFPHKTHFHSIP